MLEGFVTYPEAFIKLYREKGLWVDKTIGEELDGAVARYGDRIALACEGRYVTYRELGIRATRLALHFIDKGLRPYDRVIFQLPNELEFAYCFYAAVKIGAIPIMALPAHRNAEITFFAQFTGARAHFMPARYKDFSHQALSARGPREGPRHDAPVRLGRACRGRLHLCIRRCWRTGSKSASLQAGSQTTVPTPSSRRSFSSRAARPGCRRSSRGRTTTTASISRRSAISAALPKNRSSASPSPSTTTSP